MTSLDWVTYPILRFVDSPRRSRSRWSSGPTSRPSTAVDRGWHGALATGSGEPPTAPIAAAVANAFFDATGVRIKQTPMTPQRVRSVLKTAGVA